MCLMRGSHYEYVLSLVLFVCTLKCTETFLSVFYTQETLKNF